MSTILIVDDRAANRELLVTLLGYAGHRLLEASEGEAGLAIARAEHPDLIITDIVMPKMDGYEFARQVRSDPSIAATQIIFITASYIIEETRRLAEACGVSIVISKPIEPQAFLLQVNQALATRQIPVMNTVSEDFHQEHLLHLTNTLAKKIEELEAEIAERERAEAQIAYQANLLTHIHDTVIAVDNQFRITAWNHAAEVMYGWSAEEALGNLSTNVIRSEMTAEERQEALRQLRELGMYRNEIIQYRKDGQPVYVEAGTIALYDKDKQVMGFLSINRDITERKRAEKALDESEQRFRATFDQAAVGIAHVAPDGSWLKVNQKLCAIVGYTHEELLSKTFQDITHPDDLKVDLEFVRQVLADELKTYSMEKRYIRKDSSIVWIYLTVSLVRAKNGEPKYFIAVVEDITERKQAELELQESEKQFSTVFFTNPVSQSIFSQITGLVIEVNDACCNLYEYSRAEMLGADLGQLDLWANPADQLPILDELQRTGHVLPTEVMIRKKSGEIHTVLFTVEPISWKGIPCLLTSSMDITARKQAEEKIQRQVEYMSALRDIDSVIAAANNMQASLNRLISHTVRLLNVDAATVLLVNSERGALEYTAGSGFWTDAVLTASVKLGESYAGRAAIEQRMVHIPNLTNEPDNLLLTGLLAGEKFTSYYGIPLIVNEKVIGVLEVFNRAVVTRDTEWLDFFNTLAGQAAIAIDHARLIDDLQRSNAELEQRVEQRTAELERANRAKDEFLAIMSHELRTPLNSIMGLSESLLEQRRDPLSEYQQRYLQVITASGSHLLELINDILDLSKIEAGKFDYYPQTISVDEMCRASLSFVKEQATRKSITVTYQKETPVAKISADLRRFKQILVNLLTNAVKFTPDNGRIILQVRADAEADRIQFSVIDSGIGIALDDLKQLFVPFKQVDSRLTREYEGTGLGLALVQKLTDLHGGSVSVESEVGKGSCFTINLPLGQALLDQQAVPESDSELSSSEQAGKSNTPEPADRAVILLAEDNMANILTIGDYLESHGYPVFVAHDGFEAIELAELHEPDIILMDIQMPGLDGLEAIRRLRADSRFASTPIIALTALAMPGDRERCLEAGATDYMSKPVSLKNLVKTIEDLLQHKNE